MNDDSPLPDVDISWVDDAKFEPVRVNIDLVSRKRLIDLLDDVLNRKLALVIAPAGFGKSTLLTQWRESISERGIICAWLTLDSSDTDPNQFLANLAIALSHAGVDIGELEIGARNGFPDSPVRLVLLNVLRYLHDLNARCVIVLDDYHLAENQSVDDLVKQLLRDAPREFSIVINSRAQASVDAPVLIASGDAIEIGPDHLRLTKGETVSALGAVISAVDASEIYNETEGWPVAVQLARVQKYARPTSPLHAASAGGLVASYLTDQVLATLDEDTREFLLAVSILERFNPDLANHVGQCGNSRDLLQRLQPLVALLIPLDYDFEWYRLHHLFAEYLRETLLKETPERLEVIALRASEWHSKRGEIVEAVRYAAKATDFGECERLILDAGGWKAILTEGIGVFRNLLRYLPDHYAGARPRLLIASAYLHCKDGQQSEARLLLDASSGQIGYTSPINYEMIN